MKPPICPFVNGKCIKKRCFFWQEEFIKDCPIKNYSGYCKIVAFFYKEDK